MADEVRGHVVYVRSGDLVDHITERGDDQEGAFEAARAHFGGYYDLIAYLFFIKNKNQFLPICPGYFDAAFSKLGIGLKTSRRCSWENYVSFIEAVGMTRDALSLLLEGSEPSLLDAHSFLWMNDVLTDYLASPMAFRSDSGADALQEKDVDAIVKVRVKQDVFRREVIEHWRGRCAVTGCSLTSALIASHIKPWRDCREDNEWLNPYNGILLSPNVDKLFDKGLITFDDGGRIVLSSELAVDEAARLGITPNVEKMAEYSNLVVLERKCSDEWDTPDPACEYVMPKADFAFITGVTLINKTAPRLLELARDARVVMVGPSVVLAGGLFDYGVDTMSGSIVTDPEGLAWSVKNGAGKLFGQSLQMCTIAKQ